MSGGVIAFIVIYCLVLCCYFYTETTGKIYLRAPNKIILALMFFIFGTYMAFHNYQSYEPYLFTAALFLAMLGDIFLLFSYNRGGDFFLAGNVCFIVYQIMLLTQVGHVHIDTFWWTLLLIPILWGGYVFLFYKFPNVFKLGKMKSGIMLYLASIIPNGVFAIAVMSYLPAYRLLGVGLFLFMLSDFDIVIHKFVVPDNKWVLRLNSCLYFVGLLLVVLNFAI